jgi:hypothetical protein
VDGIYANVGAVHARCPHAIWIDYAVHASTNAGNGADCETGDMTPAQTAAWAHMRFDAGLPAVVWYMSLALWQTCIDTAHSAGVDVNRILWQVAAYPGIGAAVYGGAAGHQFDDRTPDGRNADRSVWVDNLAQLLGSGASPAPPPTPHAKGPAMLTRSDPAQGGDGSVILIGVGAARHVPTWDQVNQLSLVTSSAAPGQPFNMHPLQQCAWAQEFGAWNYDANDFIWTN